MNYPLISEYIESIMSAEDNFDQLSSLRPVLDSYGNPIMSSGNFAVVFKMKDIDTGKFYAVKCFIKDQEGRNESYAMIADELKNANSPYILPIKFLENELFVDTSQSNETEFPVLVMDWVEGKTLDAYLRENLDNKYRLQVLSYRFCQMSAWLMSQPFAHGDLKPDNILVRENGSLVLVDYDGFYVPAMKGDEARELGSPDFRHPQRTPQDFDEHIDDFSISTIALSLKAISIDAQLYHNYAASDRLLLSTNDYHDIGNSATMQKISQLASDSELATIIGAFYIALSNKILKKISNNVFDIEMPAIIIGEGKTIITKEDVKQVKEKYGELINVVIADSVSKIDGCAFCHCCSLKSIIIPDSVTEVGSGAFYGCDNLTSIIIPKSVNKIGQDAFMHTGWFENQNDGVLYLENCCLGYKGRTQIGRLQIKDGTRLIGDNAFFGSKGLTSIILPNTITRIGRHAFYGCSGLTIITIPKTLSEIGDCAFSDCNSLTSIVVDEGNEKYDSRGNCNAIIETETNTLIYGCKNTNIPNSVTEIGSYAFYGCNGLMSITIPDAVSKIGNGAFSSCSSLTSINIPKSIAEIGKRVFDNCYNLTSIFVDKDNVKYDSRDNSNSIIETSSNILIYGCKNTNIPNSVIEIGPYAFYGCKGLMSITIPNSITKIGAFAFCSCKCLTSVNIPKFVSEIECCVFNGCSSLTSIIIPNSVCKIGKWAFGGCKNLMSINIPNSVTEIGRIAFIGCSCLTSISLPNSVVTIGRDAFKSCNNLAEIVIPKGARFKFEKILGKELHSKLVEESVYIDDIGVIYSEDKTKLICFPSTIRVETYSILKECRVISENAFELDVDCDGSSVYYIGNELKEIYFPEQLELIEENALDGCRLNMNIIVPKGTLNKFKNILDENRHLKLIEEGASCVSKGNAQTDNYIQKIWNLKDFIQEFGQMQEPKMLFNPKTGEEYRVCEFVNCGEKTLVRFSSDEYSFALKDITISQIAKIEYGLYVYLYKSGTYELCYFDGWGGFLSLDWLK